MIAVLKNADGAVCTHCKQFRIYPVVELRYDIAGQTHSVNVCIGCMRDLTATAHDVAKQRVCIIPGLLQTDCEDIADALYVASDAAALQARGLLLAHSDDARTIAAQIAERGAEFLELANKVRS